MPSKTSGAPIDLARAGPKRAPDLTTPTPLRTASRGESMAVEASSELVDVSDDDAKEDKGNFSPGMLVRLRKLKSAAELNGQLAIVQRDIPQSGRLEVTLQSTNDLKAVLPYNLELLGVVEEVGLWRDLLSKPGIDVSVVRPAFIRLEALNLDVQVLQQTFVGRVVNNVVKGLNGQHEDVANMGRRLVKLWREMYHGHAARTKVRTGQAMAKEDSEPAEASATQAPKQVAGAGAEEAAPEIKRPRLAEAPAVPPAEASRTSTETTALQRAAVQSLPPELAGMDPRFAQMLAERPTILDFLKKHPSVLQNLNEDSVRFLRRNIQSSRDTASETKFDEDGVLLRTVTFTNLHPEATEHDLEALMEARELSPAAVTVFRESRRQRSCGVASATFPSREAARMAAARLHRVPIRGRSMATELLDGQPRAEKQRQAPPRIRWREEQELWSVALFERGESVTEFRGRLDSATASRGGAVAVAAAHTPEAHARFQARAHSERVQERELMREALGGP
mmetsp:Transcript_54321/g.117549  ORF Transcript_54321/g.117549 Transcript_54321/m.117549 type:complete len:509 (-) Transcript_54321:108-1634(-)